MKTDDFTNECMKTLSENFHKCGFVPTQEDLTLAKAENTKSIMSAIADFASAANFMDTVKKHVFYSPDKKVKEKVLPIIYTSDLQSWCDKLGKEGEQSFHAILGACTEVAELLEILSQRISTMSPLPKDELAAECGDILYYVACLLDVNGTSIDQSMQAVIAKLRKRYPTSSFSVEEAWERDLSAEDASIKAALDK